MNNTTWVIIGLLVIIVALIIVYLCVNSNAIGPTRETIITKPFTDTFYHHGKHIRQLQQLKVAVRTRSIFNLHEINEDIDNKIINAYNNKILVHETEMFTDIPHKSVNNDTSKNISRVVPRHAMFVHPDMENLTILFYKSLCNDLKLKGYKLDQLSLMNTDGLEIAYRR